MNLVLAHCGKEWRAQRGLLVAYSLLVFTSLALGLWLAPEHAWDHEGGRNHAWFDVGLGTHAVTWFFAAGVLGVVLFAAPNLVRAEFGSKDDQFVRRLPGALGPSFLGKLLFLLLASAALPLVGLLLGELYVAGRGYDWLGLFEWRWDGDVLLKWPGTVIACGLAMLAVPWIWAIGSWLPGGRMAVGGTVLFVLVIGVGIFAVLRQSPGIEQHIAWWPWLWGSVPLALTAVAASWCLGRRGGGPLRSARLGLAVTAFGLAPPSVWLAGEAWDYHHPDLQHLEELSVQGLSPDGRYVLARGATHHQWANVSLRIDLDTGAAEQIAGIDTALSPELDRPFLGHSGSFRFWRTWCDHGGSERIFDLATARWTMAAVGPDGQPALTAEQRAQVHAELRERTALRAPFGRRAWFEDGTLCTEELDGSVSKRAGDKEWLQAVRTAGHGFRTFGAIESVWDLAGNRLLDRKQWRVDTAAWVVRDTVVFVPAGTSGSCWNQRGVDGAAEPCAALGAAAVLGLFDDDQLLCVRSLRKKGEPPQLFLYRPADCSTTALSVPVAAVPGTSLGVAAPLGANGSLLARDPSGCIWLRSQDNRGEVFLRVDTATRQVTALLPHRRGDGSYYQLLDWPDGKHVLIAQDEKILRIDIATGERTILFPRR